MADGDALHSTRTKAFSAVGIQKTLEKRLDIKTFFQLIFFWNQKTGVGIKQERLEAR